MEWISVKDRLPTENGEYLVFATGIWGGDWRLVSDFENGIFYIDIHEMATPLNETITHWAILPEPPKNKTNK